MEIDDCAGEMRIREEEIDDYSNEIDNYLKEIECFIVEIDD